MPEYSAKLNLEKPLGTENVNRGFFTRLIDDIDSKAGSPNGLARLDQNGNVLKADGSLAGEVTAAQFTEHKEERSSVQKAGHVQLSDAISSTDTTKAATPNAVKKAYDRANEAFLSASNGKNMLTNAIAGTDPRVVIPTDPSFGQLATAVRQIQTGFKKAQGTAIATNEMIPIRNLDFTPSKVIITARSMAESSFYIQSLIPDLQGHYGENNKVLSAILYHNNSTSYVYSSETAVVTERGFNIPRVPTGSSIKWWAFE